MEKSKSGKLKMKIYADDTIPYTQEYFLLKKPLFQNITIWVICSLLAVTFLFISFAKFDEVIKVTGFIRPEENISTVSNAVTGRILTTEYKSGQSVTKGQLLLKIDPTQLEAEKESLESQMQEESSQQQLPAWTGSIECKKVKNSQLFMKLNPASKQIKM